MEAINYLITYHDESTHYLQIQLMKYQSVFDYLEQSINEIGAAKQNAADATQSSTNISQEEDVHQLDADAQQEGESPKLGTDEPRQQFQIVSQ